MKKSIRMAINKGFSRFFLSFSATQESVNTYCFAERRRK
jgi:hypothetical protein